VEDLSEKEQLDAMRAWWAENGKFVIGGVVLGVALIFGWNQYRSSTVGNQVSASMMYEDVMYAAGSGNLDAAVSAAENLLSEHADSPYAAQARLALARMYMDNARDQDAADALQAVVDGQGYSELAQVARLRLAKVLLYQSKPEDALALLDGQDDTAFAARFSEVRGDAHVAMGDYEKAEVAYRAALSEVAQARTVDVTLVQLKINDLPALEDDTTTPIASDVSEPQDDLADNPDGDAQDADNDNESDDSQ